MPYTIAALLARYIPSPEEFGHKQAILDYLVTHPQPFDRDSLPGHITGSAFILHPDKHHVLLTFHGKMDLWMQLGGHSDGDSDTLRVAHREAWEESGMDPAQLTLAMPDIFAINVEDIPAYGDMPQHTHYDIAFLFQATTENYIVSSESKDLRWAPLAQIEDYAEDPFVVRAVRRLQREHADLL